MILRPVRACRARADGIEAEYSRLPCCLPGSSMEVVQPTSCAAFLGDSEFVRECAMVSQLLQSETFTGSLPHGRYRHDLLKSPSS